ncbi:hypothetical protein FHL15_011028 [Xylaria flabelliformis]|uniref:NADAR domain-containing protein n=1 Tax=Xylaria flabelliformis TaxID=2512241 RepID=A0A553HJE6_9PEZI|nr:hypothetical protein FHL15_011028 [Xylaria flabelliformis]
MPPTSRTPTNTPLSPDPESGPIYFWRPGEPTTGFLSQWYASVPFRDRDRDPSSSSSKIYATAEHYMMHHKALLFNDAEIAEAILAVPAPSPKETKSLGRAVRNFDQAVWERERERIVREGSWCKFNLPVVEEDDGKLEGKDGEAREKRERIWSLGDGEDAPVMRAARFRDVLLATGTRELVEASPFDRIWGIGFGAKEAGKRRGKWGLNLLGKCLMEVREELRREAEAAEAERGK